MQRVDSDEREYSYFRISTREYRGGYTHVLRHIHVSTRHGSSLPTFIPFILPFVAVYYIIFLKYNCPRVTRNKVLKVPYLQKCRIYYTNNIFFDKGINGQIIIPFYFIIYLFFLNALFTAADKDNIALFSLSI